MRYVLVMLGSLVGLVIVAYLLLYLLISVGCIYPANYAEQKINEAYDTILRADKVTAEMIPALCDYVIFSENGEKIGGDLSEQYEQIAWNVAKYGNASGKYFYKVIVRENEYVVLQYRLTPQYHSAFLREHFIGPQNVMSIMSVIGAVAIIIIPSIRFGKRIKKQMQPVLDANFALIFLICVIMVLSLLSLSKPKTSSKICSFEKTCPLFLARNSQISYSAFVRGSSLSSINSFF
jgi:two-component system, OmpR family, lantibiotic biosynthesis sensor histidine kinase NisK/SpaK